MAASLLLTCVFLSVVGHKAVAVPPILLGGGYQGGGGYDKKPLILTCSMNFTDRYKNYKGIANALAVTIKIHSSMFSYGGDYGGSGLTATIDIYSSIGGPVVVAITESARPEDGCYPEHFDSFLNTKSGYGGMGAYGGIGSYGGYGGVGSYGLAGFGGMGGSYGAGYGKSYGSNDHKPVDDIPGVIAKVNLTPGTSASVNIDRLAEYHSLKDLAGRGVIVCPEQSVDSEYGDGYCDGGILSCCALHYDDSYQNVYGKY